MPVEYLQLKDEPAYLCRCPKCGREPFEPFMRGQVQRRKRTWYGKRRPYCAVICTACMEVVGYEAVYYPKIGTVAPYQRPCLQLPPVQVPTDGRPSRLQRLVERIWDNGLMIKG